MDGDGQGGRIGWSVPVAVVGLTVHGSTAVYAKARRWAPGRQSAAQGPKAAKTGSRRCLGVDSGRYAGQVRARTGPPWLPWWASCQLSGFCGLGGGRSQRANDSADTDTELTSDLKATNAGGRQLAYALFGLFGDCELSAQVLTFAPSTCQPAMDAFDKPLPFHFGYGSHDRENELSNGRAGIKLFAMQIQRNALVGQVGHEIDNVPARAAKPVNAPGGDHVDATFRGVGCHLLEGGPFVAGLRAADAVVFIDLDDFPVALCRDRKQLMLLIRGVLILFADADIDADPKLCFNHAGSLILPALSIPQSVGCGIDNPWSVSA